MSSLQNTLRHFLLAGVCTLAVTGCGSDSATPFASAGNFSSPPPPATSANLAGNVFTRVVLGAPLAQVTVRLENTRGEVLATGTTDSAGLVVFNLEPAPVDGRLVAVLPGSNVTLVKEFRGLDVRKSRPTVSLLSDLAARLVARGSTLQEAEARVRAGVGLPSNVLLDFAEPNPYFSSLALLRAAVQSGGWEAFANSFLTQLPRSDFSSRHPYRLTPELLSLSFSAITDPGLRQAALAIQSRLRTRLGLSPSVEISNQEPADNTPYLQLDITESAGAFFFGVAQGISGNIATSKLEDTMGAIFNGFGQNNASQEQLEAINQELGAALAVLTAFVNEARAQQVIVQSQNLELLFQPSKTAVLEFVSSTRGAVPQTGTPFSTPSSILRLLSQLQGGGDISLDTLTSADLILRGRAGLLRLFIQDQVLTGYGVTSVDNQSNPPFTVPVTSYDSISKFCRHWIANQLLTLELISENAHNTFPGSTSPVAALRAAQQDFNQTMVAIKEQTQLLPYPPPTSSFVFDVQANTIWQSSLSPATDNWGGVSSGAASVSVEAVYPDGSSGSFSGFSLPQDSQTLPLQARGQYAPNPGSPWVNARDRYATPGVVGNVPVESQSIGNRGITTAGLASLGFYDFDSYYNPDEKTEGQIWSFEDNQYFSLNDQDQSQKDNGAQQQSRPYLYCRDFCVYTNNVPAAPHPGAVLQFGVPTAISVAATPVQIPNGTQIPYALGSTTQQFTIPPSSVEFLANVTYQLTIGGTFRVGNGTTSTYQRDPVTVVNPAVQFSTAQSTTGSPNLLRERISWTSSNPSALRLYNIPGMGGIATPLLANQAVTVTATILDQAGQKHTATLNYTTPSSLPAPTLTSVQIMPSNQIYGASPSQSSSGSFPYYCIAYYSNMTYADVTSSANWTVAPASGASNTANAQIVKSGSGASLVMNQPAQSTPAPYNLVVTAEYQGASNSSTIRIVPPVAAP